MQTACIEKFLDEEAVDDPFVNDTFWAKGAEALRLRRANWITIHRKKTGKRRRIKGKNREWVTGGKRRRPNYRLYNSSSERLV